MMAKPERASFPSILLKCFAIFVLAVLAIVALGLVRNSVWRHTAKEERRTLVSELENDPTAIRLRAENEQSCEPTGQEYYWLCGVVIAATPSLPYGYCSTTERPLYAGALDTASQTDSSAELMFEQAILVSGSWISPANANTPYAYPDIFPPKDIPAFAPEPRIASAPLGHDWVKYRDMPILFSWREHGWETTAQEGTSLSVNMIFVHPDFPLRILRSLQENEIARWQQVVDKVVSEVSAAVVSYEDGRSCSQPPETVRFSYNIHNAGKLKKLTDWVRVHHKP